MKKSNLLQIINSVNILGNISFIAIMLIVGSLNPYGILTVAAFGFPVVVILGVVSLVFNIIYKIQDKIKGTLSISLAIISVIISGLWLVGLNYFMSNIGF